jgi:hypothetical protein
VSYLEKGGAIYPLGMFSDEEEKPSVEKSSSFKLTKQNQNESAAMVPIPKVDARKN